MVTYHYNAINSKYEVVFCYTILEQNKRLLLPVATTPNQSSATVQASVLETVFPFDPYHLKRSDVLFSNDIIITFINKGHLSMSLISIRNGQLKKRFVTIVTKFKNICFL